MCIRDSIRTLKQYNEAIRKKLTTRADVLYDLAKGNATVSDTVAVEAAEALMANCKWKSAVRKSTAQSTRKARAKEENIIKARAQFASLLHR